MKMFSNVNCKNILHLKTNILPLKTIENIKIFYSLKTFYSEKKLPFKTFYSETNESKWKILKLLLILL